MKALERNKQSFYYCTPTGKQAITVDGYKTGEYQITYSAPQFAKANIRYRGAGEVQRYGIEPSYDVTIVTDSALQLIEGTILFIEIPLTFDELSVPCGNYIVTDVIKSINGTTYGCNKIEK